MRALFGRRKPPVGLRPSLSTDERMVAWAQGEDDAVVIVTTQGVWLPGRGERLGWHQIHKATWSGSRLTVVPSTMVADRDGYSVMADDHPVVVGLADPGVVPLEVRKRVTRSVAYTVHHALPGGGVRVVARRVAGVDGVTWHVRYDGGTDPEDPQTVSATAQLVASAAAERSHVTSG